MSLAGGTQLSTQSEPGLHTAPVKVKCHSMDRNERLGNVLSGRLGKKRLLLPGLLKLKGAMTENITSYVTGVKFHPLVKTNCKNLWKTPQNTKTTMYTGTSLTGN